jgi:hypothetical protein
MPIVDTPGVWNVNIYAGATFDRTISLGTAYDLTGYDARLMARESYPGTAVMISMGTADGSIVVGGTAGTVRLIQTATQTAALGSAAGYVTANYVYDLELESGGGEVTRLLQGVISIQPEATR